MVAMVIFFVARETSHWSGVPEPSTTISPRPHRPLMTVALERRSTGWREKATPAALARTISTQQRPMRSRYSAYVLGRHQWLVETTHPDYRENVDADKLAEQTRDITWLRLDIAAAENDVPAGEHGELFDIVEFYAYYELEGIPRQLGERSFFQRKDDKIYYVDGVALRPDAYRRQEPKVGRNDPCPWPLK